VTHFTWPLNDEMRVWREGDMHQVMVTVRVGDEKIAKDGKHRRILHVIGFEWWKAELCRGHAIDPRPETAPLSKVLVDEAL